jgi:hypothetical protein
MPSKDERHGHRQPSFSLKYRSAFIIVSWLVTALVLHQYGKHLNGWLPAGSFYREWLICGGQLVWQGVLVLAIRKDKAWDYLGTMMTISLAGSLVLAMVLLTGHFISLSALVYLAGFGLVVTLMLLEHVRRMAILELDWKFSISWVVYRMFVLILIFF